MVAEISLSIGCVNLNGSTNNLSCCDRFTFVEETVILNVNFTELGCNIIYRLTHSSTSYRSCKTYDNSLAFVEHLNVVVKHNRVRNDAVDITVINVHYNVCSVLNQVVIQHRTLCVDNCRAVEVTV